MGLDCGLGWIKFEWVGSGWVGMGWVSPPLVLLPNFRSEHHRIIQWLQGSIISAVRLKGTSASIYLFDMFRFLIRIDSAKIFFRISTKNIFAPNW